MKGRNKPGFYFLSVFTVWGFKMTKFKRKEKCFNPNMIDELIKRHSASVE